MSPAHPVPARLLQLLFLLWFATYMGSVAPGFLWDGACAGLAFLGSLPLPEFTHRPAPLGSPAARTCPLLPRSSNRSARRPTRYIIRPASRVPSGPLFGLRTLEARLFAWWSTGTRGSRRYVTSICDVPGFCYLRHFPVRLNPFTRVKTTRQRAFRGRYPLLPLGYLGSRAPVRAPKPNRPGHYSWLLATFFGARGTPSPPGRYGVTGLSLFYDTPLHATALMPQLQHYLSLVRSALTLSPYRVDEGMRPFLTHAGIMPPLPEAPPHPHPVHVALERHVSSIVATLLKGLGNSAHFGTVAVRADKLRLWTLSPSLSFAPHVKGKDLRRHGFFPLATTLPAQVPPVLWFHHGLPYSSPKEIGTLFDQHPELRTLVCTAVVPAETLLDQPSRFRKLYQVRYRGQLIDYVPEGDARGTYTQPLSARDWLTAKNLITPAKECLHVSIVESVYAHHVILISRPQLVAEDERHFDFGNFISIPWLAHPLGSAYDRLTDPTLQAEMIAFVRRNANLTRRSDINAKITAYANMVDAKYPFHVIAAAELGTYYYYVFLFTADIKPYYALLARLSTFLQLPLVPFAWLLQSWNSARVGDPFRHPTGEVIDTTSLAARARDHAGNMFNVAALCPTYSPIWWIPVGLGFVRRWWIRITVFSAMHGYLLVAKLAFIELPLLAWRYRGPVRTLLHYLWWSLDPTAERVALGVLALLLVTWFSWFHVGYWDAWHHLIGSFPPSPVHFTFTTIIQVVYGLPSSPYRSNGGHGPFTQFLVAAQLWWFFSPRPLPPYLTPYPAFTPSQVHALFPGSVPKALVAGGLLACVIVEQFTLALLHRRQSAVPRPWHPDHLPTIPLPDPEAEPTPDPVIVLLPALPVRPDGPPVELPIELPPAPIVPAPEIDPAPPNIPAVFMPNPYAAYAAWPALQPDFPTWRRIMFGLPIPQIPRMDPALLCVWDSLGRIFGLPPATLLACYLSSLPPANFGDLEEGPVPLADLPAVLAFFNGPFNVYRTIQQQGRLLAQQNQGPMISYVGTAGWPGATLCLYNAPGGLHLQVADPDFAAVVQPPQFPPAAPVALASTRIPLAAIGANLQIPMAWTRVYDRLVGNLPNTAALASGALGALRSLPAYVQLPAVQVAPQVFQHTTTDADRELARHLTTDLKQFPNVLEFREEGASGQLASITRHLSAAAKNLPDRTVEIVVLNGLPSAGKSHYVRRMLPTWEAQGEVRIHCWKNALRASLERTFRPLLREVTERTFCTKWVPMFQPHGDTLIFDDAGLLPPNFIPLLIYATQVRRIVLTFDSSQQRPPFPEADSQSRTDPTTCLWISNLCAQYPGATYGTIGRRFCLENSALFGTPRALDLGNQVSHGAIYIVSQPMRGIPLLVTSPRFAESKSRGLQTFPLSDVQGDTVFGDLQIDLGGLSSSLDDSQAWMALTRATGSIFLVMPLPQQTVRAMTEPSYGSSLILSAILAVAVRYNTAIITPAVDRDRLIARAVQAHLSNSLPATASAALGLAPIHHTVAGWSDYYHKPRNPDFAPPANLPPAIDWTPALAYSYGTQYVSRAPAPALAEYNPLEHSRRGEIAELLRFQTVVDLDTTLNPSPSPPEVVPSHVRPGPADPAVGHHDPRYPLAREAEGPRGGFTSAFNPNMSHLGQHHSRRDVPLVDISLNARIPIREPQTRSYHRREAKRLMKGLHRFVNPGDYKFDAGLWADCHRDRLQSWLGHRTLGQVARSVERAGVSWVRPYLKLFLKSQDIKKIDVAHANLKKGQIVTDRSPVAQAHDNVWALYVERQLLRRLKPTTYVHMRANFTTVAAWYSRFWTSSKPVTYCDYTGWDSGVDERFTLFYREVYLSFGVPLAIADDYARDRHLLRSFLGKHGVHEPSGGRPTFLNNTIGNMALTGISFEAPADTPACFAGDDMIMLGTPKFVSPGATYSFQPKTTVAPRGEFCGLMFGGPRLYVSPGVLAHRGQKALEDGRNDPDYWLSYARALRFATDNDFYASDAYSHAYSLYRTAASLFSLPPNEYVS